MAKEMKLLFSLTKKDFEVQTFCTGGPGGQHKNAKQNGVRIIHTASGARSEHRDGRDQAANKKKAFEKLAKNDVFLKWHRGEVARRLGQLAEIDHRVNEQMRAHNLRVEEY
jgi:protein subunit release factor A